MSVPFAPPGDSFNSDGNAPVYRGGSITGIHDLADKLGAKADYDPATGRATVNGKVIPWATNLNGRPQGSIHDVVAAVGGHRIVQEPGGVHSIYPVPRPGLRPTMPGAPGTPDTFGTGAHVTPTPIRLGQPLHPPVSIPSPIPHPVTLSGGTALPLSVNDSGQQPAQVSNPLTAVAQRHSVMPTRPVVLPEPTTAALAIQNATAPTSPDATAITKPAPPVQAPAPSAAPAPAATATATSAPAQPSLGNGTATTAAQAAANDEKLKDPAYVKSEIERTKAVIQARQAAGLSTTDQAAYLAKLTAIDIHNQQPAVQQSPATTATTPATQPPTTGQGAPTSSASAQPPAAGNTQTFNYQPAPIDYKALQDRAALEAQMWATPQLQALKDAADLANQRYLDQSGYIRDDLRNSITDLRGGEADREKRISELMNQRGDALYGSGVHLGAIRDQQLATQAKELKLTQGAQAKLEKLTDSLGLTLKSLANKQAMIGLQQGNKALLTLQQLADKAESAQFQNRKLAWQMYMQGSQLDLQGQKMANDLWLNIQRIKSADDRAAAEISLKRWIATGQLEQKWTEMMGVDSSGNPTRQSLKDASDAAYKQAQLMGYTRAPDGSLIRTLDGQKFDLAAAQALSKETGYVIGLDGKPLTDGAGNPVRTLAGAQFDWDKQKFMIAENWKESYEGALLQLKQQGQINDQQYKQAQLDIQKGQLSIQLSKLLGTVIDPATGKPMLDDSGNPIPVADGSGTSSTAQSNAAWKGVLGDLGDLVDPVKSANMSIEQRKSAAQAIVSRWLPQLSAAEQNSLKNWLKANGLM